MKEILLALHANICYHKLMLSGVKIEQGKYGRRAVITSAWSKEMTKYLTGYKVVELELNDAKGWIGSDLSFLSELPHLESFEILDLRSTIQDISPIHFLHNLKRLGVTTYCSTEIKFSAFPRLESCGLEWGKRKAQSLFDCHSLKELFVNRYNGKEIVPFTKLTNLESLAIFNAPIESLQGLGHLKKLRSLRLALLRKLTSLKGIEGLTQLEYLNIKTCRNIGSIEEIGGLSYLRKLELNNNGDIKSLRPLDNLANLEIVGFAQSTNIVDGDLSPLFRQKNLDLSQVSFQNRRHYSCRMEDFDAARSNRIVYGRTN
jgi:hypothetical protein